MLDNDLEVSLADLIPAAQYDGDNPRVLTGNRKRQLVLQRFENGAADAGAIVQVGRLVHFHRRLFPIWFLKHCAETARKQSARAPKGPRRSRKASA